jgi:hypothetical protein
MSDRIRVSLYGTVPSDGYEIGLQGTFLDTSGSGVSAILTRKVMSVVSGDYIEYDIDFLNPWLFNYARIVLYLVENADVPGLIDTSGNIFTGRSAGAQLPASASYLLVSNDTTPWSPTQYKLIGSPTSLTTNLIVSGFNRAAMFFLWYGLINPSVDITVNEIGIYTKVYDTGGAAREIAVARVVLSSPLTLSAGKYNVILIKWVAF